MKTKILNHVAIVLFLAGSFFSCESSENLISGVCKDSKDEYYFYNHSGEKYFLYHLNDRLIVGFDKETQVDEIKKYLNQTGLFKPVDVYNGEVRGDYRPVIVNTKRAKTCDLIK